MVCHLAENAQIFGIKKHVAKLAARFGEIAQSMPNMAEGCTQEQAKGVARLDKVILRGVPEDVSETSTQLAQTVQGLIPNGLNLRDCCCC